MSPRSQVRALALTTTLIAGTALAPVALAGKATVESREGDTADFEYAGDMLRIGTQEQSGYMLVREGTMYVVSLEGDQPMVFNASSMLKDMSKNATQVAPETLNSEFVSLTDTGRDETIAGLRGDVYELTFRDDGKERTEEIVLSGDPRAREFSDALFAMTTMASELTNKGESTEEGRKLQQRMQDMNVGVLRFGQEMTVTAISSEKIPAARFELPAAPMEMQGLGGILGSMSQSMPAEGSSDPVAGSEAPAEAAEEEGGLFSKMKGMLGGKAERQTERAGDSVEGEIDERTDNGVDKAINKAFGKLFGDGG